MRPRNKPGRWSRWCRAFRPLLKLAYLYSVLRRKFMRRFCLVYTAGFAILVLAGLVPGASTDGPYRGVKTVKVGGAGTFDTACADIEGRKLYIPRKNPGRITVFNLDTLEPAGEIPDAAANGVVIDSKSRHGFASSQPLVMWEGKTLKR